MWSSSESHKVSPDWFFAFFSGTIKNLGEITVWPPRKQRPVRVCFIFFSSQINPRFPKEPVWFGTSFVPARSAPLHTPPAQSLPVPPTVLLFFLHSPAPSPSPQAPASSLGSVRKLLEWEMSLWKLLVLIKLRRGEWQEATGRKRVPPGSQPGPKMGRPLSSRTKAAVCMC